MLGQLYDDEKVGLCSLGKGLFWTGSNVYITRKKERKKRDMTERIWWKEERLDKRKGKRQERNKLRGAECDSNE